MAEYGTFFQKCLFTIVLTAISRLLRLRDRWTGRLKRLHFGDASAISRSWLKIPSGSNALDAIFVKPRKPVAAVLICHGIGEVVERWQAVQRLLAEDGVASLVFDYCGYGRSTGRITAAQCEQDAIAAFSQLQVMLPSMPTTMLGFSMGSGIATAILDRVPVQRLVLCAAFTSFKEAAIAVGFPRPLNFLVPDLWRNEETLHDVSIPTLIVHGEEDRLFPTTMATRLRDACHTGSELVLVPDLAHDDPYYRPGKSYWGEIAFFLKRRGISN